MKINFRIMFILLILTAISSAKINNQFHLTAGLNKGFGLAFRQRFDKFFWECDVGTIPDEWFVVPGIGGSVEFIKSEHFNFF